MSLKNTFAKVLMKAGLYPAPLVREQLFIAVQSDNPAAVENLFAKTPSVAAYHVPVEEGGRAVPVFEAAVMQKSFKAAAAMIPLIPDALTGDYSAGEDFIRRSILMQRAISGDSDEVAFLIVQGADVKATDDNGDTALHFATGVGKIETAGVLEKAGAAVNAANKKGVTPLMLATRGYTPDMAKSLVVLGADIAVCDAQGLNATMHAIHNQNIAAASYLMQQGGKVTDQKDPAVDRIRLVATHEGEFDFLRLLNSQYDIERNRQDELAKMTMKEICDTGTSETIKVKPIRLKR